MIPCDLSDNVKELHIFLYEDSAYTASDTVKQNSEKSCQIPDLNPTTDIKKEGSISISEMLPIYILILWTLEKIMSTGIVFRRNCSNPKLL